MHSKSAAIGSLEATDAGFGIGYGANIEGLPNRMQSKRSKPLSEISASAIKLTSLN